MLYNTQNSNVRQDLDNSLPDAAADFFRCGLAKYPDLADRIERAAELVRAHLARPELRIIIALREGRYLVRGHGDNYYVSLKGCSCPDHVQRAHEGIICKHRIACGAMEAIQRASAHQAEAA